MTTSILKGLVQGYLSSMLEEGVVTEHFYGMVSQRQVEAERNQIVQLVEKYFADVDTSLSELSGHVDNSEVDFSVLASLARGIEDKSARDLPSRVLILPVQNSVFLPQFSSVRMTLRARCRWSETITLTSTSNTEIQVTEHFYGMVSQRQVEAERNQIVQLVETYFADVDTSLSELSGHVDNSEVDFCSFFPSSWNRG
ncbi:HPT domain superfamily [Sesbania bispinosa]|nr:HPT domain superfamily [Sesbania bispinosa]